MRLVLALLALLYAAPIHSSAIVLGSGTLNGDQFVAGRGLNILELSGSGTCVELRSVDYASCADGRTSYYFTSSLKPTSFTLQIVELSGPKGFFMDVTSNWLPVWFNGTTAKFSRDPESLDLLGTTYFGEHDYLTPHLADEPGDFSYKARIEVVTPIPLPASAWLLLFSLCSLIFVRRNRQLSPQ